MPNHCWNDLTIIGPKDNLDDFCKYNISFVHFFPPPDNLTDGQKYVWCIRNWGTNSDNFNLLIRGRDDPNDERYNENLLECKFTTAWAPPIDFLKKLVDKYPNCWVKLLWTTEHNTGGVFVYYLKNSKSQTICTRWNEPAPYLSENNTLYINDTELENDLDDINDNDEVICDDVD